jgi:SAM-dependent methyltransferase
MNTWEKNKVRKAPVRSDQKLQQEHRQNNQPKDLYCKCCGNNSLSTAGIKDNYTFWECTECAFIFTEVEYHEMVDTYRSGYHNVDDGAPEKGWASSMEFLIPAFSCLPGTQLKIMDFGCGESYIPDRLRQVGHHVTAVDIVPPLKPHPDRLTGDIMELDIPVNTFDLIYSYQVFEHISEPKDVLKRLFSLVKDDGMILIHTDMETPERKNGKFTDWWYVLPPDHCSFYSHRTFDKMVSDMGHRVIYKDPKVVLVRKG